MDGGFPRLYRNICREKVKYQLARFGENYRNIEKLPDLPVAALTAQPLAALPPYGCGVPLAGCERPAGWQYLRHKFIGAMPSSLSLRGGRRPTWQSRSTRPDHRKAIGENAAAFPRLPRRFAPRNDTSGSAVVHQRPPTVELPCTGRSLSAATVKFDSDCVRRHSVYIGSAFPRLPRPLRGLAMTIRECMPFSRWPVSCAGAAPGGTCPSPTIITIFNVYLEESRWRI